MTPASRTTERPDFGYDAPGYLVLHGLAAAALVVVGAWTVLAGSPVLGSCLLALGVVATVMTGLYLHATRRGKLRVWEDVLDRLELDGTERILDLGCGRGAVLIAVARRLSRGTVVGLDIWSTRDQSGNAARTTVDNVRAARVDNRVELRTGSMTSLPFPDDEFDLIVSSLAVHNLRHSIRLDAIDEAVRVVRPGGRIEIVDLFHTRDYQERLRELGMREVTVRRLGPRFWYGSPFWSGDLVSARKRPGDA